MTSWLCRLALLAALAPAAGCIIEIGDGDDDPCIEPPIARQRIRDPYSGQCFTSGGGHCGDDDIVIQAKSLPRPNGGLCDTYCEALDEYSCSADPGCHAAYIDSCPPNADCSESLRVFEGCWAIAPYAEPGSCYDLYAEGCAGRNDCSPVYYAPLGIPEGDLSWQFQACIPENPLPPEVCTSDEECGPGQHCNLQDYCYPHPNCREDLACPPVCYGKCEPDEPNGCDRIDCGPGYHCEIVCHPPPPCRPGDGVCIDTCGETCVPDAPQPGECEGAVACDALPPACPTGTVPGILNACWSGYCIPVSECGHDPGHCLQPGEMICRTQPPACPADTVPGVENGCWSGYCIPEWACSIP